VPRLAKITLILLNLYSKDNFKLKLAANILVLTDGKQKSYTDYYGWMGFGESSKK
jgi:hypothetical protein